jgi:hypothetical protein
MRFVCEKHLCVFDSPVFYENTHLAGTCENTLWRLSMADSLHCSGIFPLTCLLFAENQAKPLTNRVRPLFRLDALFW